MTEAATETPFGNYKIHDNTTGKSYEFELKKATKDIELFDPQTAAELIAQEEAQIETYTPNRKLSYGISIGAGLGGFVVQTAIYSLLFPEISTKDIASTSALLGGIASITAIALAEVIHYTDRGLIPKENATIQERIDVIKRNTNIN